MEFTSIKKAGRTIMGVLSGNPQKEPMHYGEVFGVWSYLASTQGLLVGYQALLNHAGDRDLKKIIEDMIQTKHQEIEQVQNLLKTNGVALPPSPAEKSFAQSESIPVGARFTDPEISASLSRDIATGLTACSLVIGQSVREDIAMMFGQFHMTKSQFGARLLRLNKEKGWLIPPPLHVGTPEPVHV